MDIGAALAAAVAEANVGGAVAMVGNRAGVRYAGTFGPRDAAGGAPMALDTVFQLASMTKALTSVAAMQLVERGALQLDAPVAALLPALGRVQVLDGFDADGRPRLRAAKRPITLRHLLTHTAGFGYDFASAVLAKSRGAAGPPPPFTMASIGGPLLFDPGDAWEYGVATDWAGLVVEAASEQRLDAYLTAEVTGPLGMIDTVFHLDEARRARLATLTARQPDGSLTPFPITIGGPPDAEFIGGGGALNGTAGDYLRFLRMLLNGGSLDGVRILQPATVAEMSRNQIGRLRAGAMASVMPAFSHPTDIFPGQATGWGLGFAINPEPGPSGRAGGSLAWAGIANTYYWIDPVNDVAAVLMLQLLPFADPAALALYEHFERLVYGRS